MKLIVGLGNYGDKYENTRHNAGFIFIDRALKKYNYLKHTQDSNSLIYFSQINNEKVLFLKPQTYMNLSGQSIIEVANYYKIKKEDILIIYDDKDLPVGKLRFRDKGSAGGHNGIKNIISHFGNDEFKRLKIGVGSPINNIKIVDWVLMKFNKEDLDEIINLIDNKIEIIEDFVNNIGFNNIANKYS